MCGGGMLAGNTMFKRVFKVASGGGYMTLGKDTQTGLHYVTETGRCRGLP